MVTAVVFRLVLSSLTMNSFMTWKLYLLAYRVGNRDFGLGLSSLAVNIADHLYHLEVVDSSLSVGDYGFWSWFELVN